MKLVAVFLLIAGCFWVLFVAWLFLSIAGVADSPTSIIQVLAYWGALCVGPFALLIGPILLLKSQRSVSGLVLVVIGCVACTVFVISTTLDSFAHRQPLEAPPSYVFYAVFVAAMILIDGAAYFLVRHLMIERAHASSASSHSTR